MRLAKLLLMGAILLCAAPAVAGGPTPASQRAVEVDLRSCLARQAGEDPSGCLAAAIAQERTAAGVPAIARRGDVDVLAASWSRYMAAGGCGYLPDGHPDICHNFSGYHMAASSYSSENVALGMDCGAGDRYDVVQLFLNSPHHYANIVNGRVNTFGVGGAWAGATLYVAEDFQTFGSVPKPAPRPPASPPVPGSAPATTKPSQRPPTASAKPPAPTPARSAAPPAPVPVPSLPPSAQSVPAATPLTAAAPSPVSTPPGGRGSKAGLVVATGLVGLAVSGWLTYIVASHGRKGRGA